MKNNKLSEDFLKKITDIAAGFLRPDILNSFIKILQTEIKNHYFSYAAESNLLRIISGMYDKYSFITDAVLYPRYIEILTAISVNSNYLTDILVRNPEYFYRIVNPSHLNKKLSPEELRELIKSTVGAFKTMNGKVNSLRNLKRRELLRTGTKDILKISGLEEITAELSWLARELSAELFNICYIAVLEKYGIKKTGNIYCIVSLGKLGGEELNYSSDIDIIIFYDKDSRLGNKEYREILTEAVYLFIEQASSVTSGGYIYRIDLRLRPDGRNAPLCSTITDYLNYYESRGEDWERQMLIKAGFLGGNKELYDKFITYLQPFIYPSSFKSPPGEQIKKLKANIENALLDERNIKLAQGGIRDIEFTIQALQLINGYRNDELKKSNTLDALSALALEKLLTKEETGILREAYLLYRKIEHFLQLMNDLQTHTIPQEGEMLLRLYSFLEYGSEKDFLNDIAVKRKNVAQIFASVTGSAKESSNIETGHIKFHNNNLAAKNLSYLREGKGLLGSREFDSHSINSFSRIESDLIEYLRVSRDPDLVLQNFVRIIKSSGFPSVWYNSFADKKFFKLFLNICENCQRAVDLFSEDINLQEYYLSGEVFRKVQDVIQFSTKKLVFTLSIQFCAKMINEERFSDLLKLYFTAKINNLAVEYLPDEKYMIASLGSLGTGDMSFASDVDIIFVVADIKYSTDQQKIFVKYLNRLKEEFKPFETDCRLRPEGKSSQLVWSISTYKDYITTRARIWELQAFTKVDFICGERKLFNSLTASLKKRLIKENCTSVLTEIKAMRKKLYPADLSGVAKNFNIKKSAGGLTDIEFLTQYLILCNPELYSKCRGKKISKVLHLLSSHITGDDLEQLTGGYQLLRNIDVANQNIFNVNTHIIPGEDLRLSKISEYLGYKTSEEFNSAFRKSSMQIRNLYEKYLSIK